MFESPSSLTIAIFVAMACMFVVASKRSRAGRLSAALKAMVGKPVDVRVWGTPIAGHRVHSIRAFGAGLHFLLEPRLGGKPTRLKIAQPESASHDERRLVIDDARYVQWRGRRMPRAEGVPALEVVVVDDRE